MFLKRESHFKSIKELRDLYPLLKELQNKDKELTDLVDNNAGNPSYKKSVIITNLCQQIDLIINEFNNLPVPSDSITEINNICVLIASLKDTITLCLAKHRAVLNTPRPTMTHLISQKRTPVIVASSTLLGFATGSFLFASVPLFGGVAIEYGLNASVTASVAILERLLSKLETIGSSFYFVANELINNQVNTVAPSAPPIMEMEELASFNPTYGKF
ncbi:MAG: hypothetical protein QM652_00035 [Legionella sp.]|uniref:hypothetical protein n=1 Tax=Legionella sp. TaxID=459 RepID=UPI0039E35077